MVQLRSLTASTAAPTLTDATQLLPNSPLMSPSLSEAANRATSPVPPRARLDLTSHYESGVGRSSRRPQTKELGKKFLQKSENCISPKKILATDLHSPTLAHPQLSIENLTKLSVPLATFLKNVSAANADESELIKALWYSLTKNTNALSGQWNFIRNEAPISRNGYLHDGTNADQRVLHRFDSIGLVSLSALVDKSRTTDPHLNYFLHANQIDFKCGRQFIASQLPMGQEVPGFHRMLADKGVALVVDLTSARERESRARYFPNQHEILKSSPTTQVSCSASFVLDDPRYSLDLYNVEIDEKPATLMHRLHFVNWPIHETISPRSLIELGDLIDRLAPDAERPIVIHSNAGMGRTGALMSFMAARKKIDNAIQNHGVRCTPEVIHRTLLEVIARGRLERGPYFLENREQYQLVCKALIQSNEASLVA
jgi:protein tyrosine phosphatase